MGDNTEVLDAYEKISHRTNCLAHPALLQSLEPREKDEVDFDAIDSTSQFNLEI